jgi:hypothetical protein
MDVAVEKDDICSKLGSVATHTRLCTPTNSFDFSQTARSGRAEESCEFEAM